VKYYTVAELEITDRTWVGEYVEHVTKLIEERGGRYLARTHRVEKKEGERAVPQLVLLVEWPSREVADAFYDSEEYRPFLERRLAGSRSEMLLVPGEDVTGKAKID
jgi:uncharacterized protein (DUF1330 family)